MLRIWPQTRLSNQKCVFNQNLRWRPPTSWLSKICCHFFTIGPILTKICGNVEKLTKNATVISKAQNYQSSRWRPPPYWTSKIYVAISLLLDQSSPNLMGMLRVWHRTHLFCQKSIFIRIQDGVRRHCELPKCVAISLLLDQSSPNLMGVLKIWQRTHVANSIFNAAVESEMSIKLNFKDGGCRHTEFRKDEANSLPLNSFSPNML